MNASRKRRPQYAPSTPERNRQYLQRDTAEDAVRAHLAAGIEEFRRMLEVNGRGRVMTRPHPVFNEIARLAPRQI